MKVNIYLPDELGERAKNEELNLSRMLRDAVTAELRRKDRMDAALQEPTTYEIEVEIDGHPVIGRIIGTKILDSCGEQLYLTANHRVLHVAGSHYVEFTNPDQDLYDYFIEGRAPEERDIAAYIEACEALGFRPVINL